MESNIKTARRHSYTYLTEEEYDQLDQAVQTLGFNNRSEFQTACALTVINGDLPGDWCRKLNRRVTTTNRAQSTINRILDNIYLPVLAMKGFAILADSDVRTDIRRELFDETGYVPGDEELNAMFERYKSLRKDRLAEHRRCVFAAKYGELQKDTETEEKHD
ncbi:MAG TPA: hypothetical protein O0X39_07685 [Methanocorpusculum sp.]|nr:hypothetical protein [Methanocorpusculum sp.]